MGESGPNAQNWEAQLAATVARGEPSPMVYSHVDLLLLWLASPNDPSIRTVAAAFRRLPIDLAEARRLAFRVLDEVLFRHPDEEPDRVLGFDRRMSRKAIRARYLLLMRVYHPDLWGDDPAPPSGGASRLNIAYARLQQLQGPISSARRLPSKTRLRFKIASDSHRSPRLLRFLAFPRWMTDRRTVQRCCILAVLVLCTALVIHACVSNEAWVRWSLPSRSLLPIGLPSGCAR